MGRLRKLLEQIARALKLNHHLLAIAQRRYFANRKRAYRAHNQQLNAHKRADVLRSEGHVRAAEKADSEAARHSAVAYRNHLRAQHFLAVIKRLQDRIHGLRERREKVAGEIDKWAKKHKVHMTAEGKVAGGTRRQRLRFAIHKAAYNCAHGLQNNYYSMSGLVPILIATIIGMPFGHRFDCSSFGTGIHYVCDLPDPNGNDYDPAKPMWTESLRAHCEVISKAEAQTGDFVWFRKYPGDREGHHVEVVDDPAHETTIGHGSGPIDSGVYDLFGDGEYELLRNPALKPNGAK